MTATRQVSTTFLTKILLFVVGFAASILVARILGTEGKGLFALLILVPSFIVSIGTLGIGNAAIYFLGTRRYGVSQALGSCLLLAGGLGVGYLGLALALDALELLPWNLPPGLLALSLLSVPFWLLRHYLSDILRAVGRFGAYNLVQLCQPIAQLVLLVALVALFQLGVGGAVVAHLAAVILVSLTALGILMRHRQERLRIDRGFIRDATFYGLKGHVGVMGQKFNLRLDQLLIGAWLAPAQLGIYTVAVALAELIWYVPDSIGVVLLPKVAATASPERASALCARVFRITLLLSVALALALGVLGGSLIALFYGSAFLPGVVPMLLLLPGVVAMSLSKVLSKYLVGVGRPGLNSVASLASLATTVIGCLWLIPILEIRGAALASTAAYTVHAALSVAFFLRVAGLRPGELLAFCPGDLSAVRAALGKRGSG